MTKGMETIASRNIRPSEISGMDYRNIAFKSDINQISRQRISKMKLPAGFTNKKYPPTAPT